MKKLAFTFLMLLSAPSFAQWPCNLGDYGVTYVVSVREGCRTGKYGMTCGGSLGDSVVNIFQILISPPCINL